MDPLPHLEALLRFPGSRSMVADAAVLTCGCLVSEALFFQTCPNCLLPAAILKPVQPLRDLHRLVVQLQGHPRRRLSLKRSTKTDKLDVDLMGLFVRYAKDEAAQSAAQFQASQMSSLSTHTPSHTFTAPVNVHQARVNLVLSDLLMLPEEHVVDALSPETSRGHLARAEPGLESVSLVDLLALTAQDEYNFLRCFPFHRKVSSYATQQKLLFSSRVKTAKFSALAIASTYDRTAHTERTVFALVADKKWELHQYTRGRPVLVACGRLTGEYGPLASELHAPADPGVVVRNDFGLDTDDTAELAPRLRLWVQLHCCLLAKYLVIAGTRGVLRVLNADPAAGPVGAPVYTYLTNFPIRCVALAPNNAFVACGITAKERLSGKQQPFVILHPLAKPGPITITVPYRDPLKLITFNALLTHLLCCTVYEMRYFVIRLRTGTSDYRRPRLVWSDMRVARRTRSDEDDLLRDIDDDLMLDNEGITDIRFGRPFSNTVVVTTSLLKNRPSIVLRLNGPTIDTREKPPRDYYDVALHASLSSADDDAANIVDADVVMKVPEIGSNVYRVALLPRGDGMVFVDKLGRLLLVVPAVLLGLTRNRVVLLGESADALRLAEATSVQFSSDGGKVFAVDRKGLFQVFDFTKGIPGEDPEVIKCKIISV